MTLIGFFVAPTGIEPLTESPAAPVDYWKLPYRLVEGLDIPSVSLGDDGVNLKAEYGCTIRF